MLVGFLTYGFLGMIQQTKINNANGKETTIKNKYYNRNICYRRLVIRRRLWTQNILRITQNIGEARSMPSLITENAKRSPATPV